MGTDIYIAAPAQPDRRETVKLLADSGSMYTWVSGAVLRGTHRAARVLAAPTPPKEAASQP